MNRFTDLARDRRGGLTLIETLLAITMLSLLIVGLLGLLGTLLTNSTKASDFTAGIYAGQYLLNKARTDGPPAPSGGTVTDTFKLLNHEEKLPVEFHYTMEWFPTGETVAYPSGPAKFGAKLYEVKITIWWMIDKPGEGRAEGGGKRTVSLERLIKVKNL